MDTKDQNNMYNITPLKIFQTALTEYHHRVLFDVQVKMNRASDYALNFKKMIIETKVVHEKPLGFDVEMCINSNMLIQDFLDTDIFTIFVLIATEYNNHLLDNVLTQETPNDKEVYDVFLSIFSNNDIFWGICAQCLRTALSKDNLGIESLKYIG
jgi:hypothetical protein